MLNGAVNNTLDISSNPYPVKNELLSRMNKYLKES